MRSVRWRGKILGFLYPAQTATEYVFYALLSVVALLVMIGIAACVFNELRCAVRPCFIVDSARWTVMLVFALQFYDFGLFFLQL